MYKDMFRRNVIIGFFTFLAIVIILIVYMNKPPKIINVDGSESVELVNILDKANVYKNDCSEETKDTNKYTTEDLSDDIENESSSDINLGNTNDSKSEEVYVFTSHSNELRESFENKTFFNNTENYNYTDPSIVDRNKIDEDNRNTSSFSKFSGIYVFDPNNVEVLSNLTEEQIRKLLSNTPLQKLASKYCEMEKQYNINALFLIGLEANESAYGTSNLAIHRNNLGGTKDGYGSWKSYESWEESLDATSRLLRNEYLNPSGRYYVSNKSVQGINDIYCPQSDDPGNTWAENICNIVRLLISKNG